MQCYNVISLYDLLNWYSFVKERKVFVLQKRLFAITIIHMVNTCSTKDYLFHLIVFKHLLYAYELI